MSDGGHARCETLGTNELDGGRANVHHEGVDQLDVVPETTRQNLMILGVKFPIFFPEVKI